MLGSHPSDPGSSPGGGSFSNAQLSVFFTSANEHFVFARACKKICRWHKFRMSLAWISGVNPSIGKDLVFSERADLFLGLVGKTHSGQVAMAAGHWQKPPERANNFTFRCAFLRNVNLDILDIIIHHAG